MSISHLDLQNYKNVSIICENSTQIKTNRFIISCISSWLNSLIMEQDDQDEITIICPDVKVEKVTNLVKALESFVRENILLELVKRNPEDVIPFCKLFNLQIKDENKDKKEECKGEIFEEEQEVKIENEIDQHENMKKGIPDLSLVQYKSSTAFFQCNKCPESFQDHTELDRHVKTHHIIKFALLQSDNDGELSEMHEKVNVSRITPKARNCRFCGEKYKSSLHILNHKLDQFSCDCNETWVNHVQKMKHMQVVHMGFIPCTICSKSFRKQELFTLHIEHYHNKGNKDSTGGRSRDDWPCTVCGHSFRYEFSLKNHIKAKHEKGNKNLTGKRGRDDLSCTICGKSFRYEFRLINHLKGNHTEDGEQVCDICGKKYENKVNLQKHKSDHKLRGFCSICNKDVKNLRIHLRVTHVKEEDKEYICESCGKAFAEKSKLKAHAMNVHIKSRPYNCRYGCTFAYNDGGNRNAHERKKHGVIFQGIKNENSKN